MKPTRYTPDQVAIYRAPLGHLRLVGPLFGPGYVAAFERLVGPEDQPVYDNALRMLEQREHRVAPQEEAGPSGHRARR